MMRNRRNAVQKSLDFITFPIRAFFWLDDDRWGLSSLRSERFDYVSRDVRGFCLDIGCERENLFLNRYLEGNGKGIDVFPYEGLTQDNIIKDMTKFPFDDNSFESVTLIATINHIPRSMRDAELKEAYRCLKPGGNIIVTMGNPIAEIMVHKVAWMHDRLFGTNYDMDSKRGMHKEEAYYLKDPEIVERLLRAGFKDTVKKYFCTQWGLNHLFVAYKREV